MDYYNENNPYAVQWLKNLISKGAIEAGKVDERSIKEVRAKELKAYRQVHMFAGIAGWAQALQLACWPKDRVVWTGSPPCQPFSVAGAGKGRSDERHLWPVWFELIKECRPSVIFGEQVAAAINYGWLDALQDDLEGEGYACAATILPACSVGAPHLRQRLWFVAYAGGERSSQLHGGWEEHKGSGKTDVAGYKTSSGLGDTDIPRAWRISRGSHETTGEESPHATGLSGAVCNLGNRQGRACTWQHNPCDRQQGQTGKSDLYGHLANAQCDGCHAAHGDDETQPNANRSQDRLPLDCSSELWATRGYWREADWIYCRDDRFRAVEPGTLPLVDGVQGRVELVRPLTISGKEIPQSHLYSRAGAIKGYGNAIVPQVAAEVIKAFMALEKEGLL
ncbi:MAG: DNA cytosine methyltransferase [Saezia sp.]